jgi:GT2 family glycosyltransferase
VIVVDNASSDGTAEYVTTLSGEQPSLRLIANSANVGFAAGNNQGARAADGEIIAFLNNDTVVTQNWLETLVSHLDNPRAGMVGPVTNSSGNESRIPVEYRNLEEMQAFAQEYCQEHTGEYFDISMLAFMCVAIRRSVFEEVGPLDESFGLGMFEDDDYALRLKQAGYRILCARDAFVHHWGSASFSRLNRKEFFRIYNQNRRKFERKWGVRWTRHKSPG